MTPQPRKFSRVSVLGLGYIGLPTAAVIANSGVDVLGVDVVEHVRDTINRGHIHIVEPELEDMVRAAVSAGRLRAVPRPEPSDAFIIAVPTPFKDDHEPDLQYVEAAMRSLAPVLKPGNLIVLESTSPVGTTEKMAALLRHERPDLTFPDATVAQPDVHIAYCPERVLPGRVLRELVTNDRVIGGMTPACSCRAAQLYMLFVRGACIPTDAKTAEMVKLCENAYRDVCIGFANELSILCDRFGVNAWELIELANRHPRVNILQPGTGVGGHCIAVDPWFLAHAAPREARLIRTAREVNDAKPHFVVANIAEQARRIENPVVACLGLAFKPDIDDLRESPAMTVVNTLADMGVAELLAVEPNVRSRPARLADSVLFVDQDEALARADIVAILVRHNPFSRIAPETLKDKVVLDFVDALTLRPMRDTSA